jgi:tetraacyldisaccharide 4'-kinase
MPSIANSPRRARAAQRQVRPTRCLSWQDDNETVLTPGQRPATWLDWAAWPYELAVRLRAYGYERDWFVRKHLSVPVVSIGNLTVGGTGKTPLVIEITQWLLDEGKRVSVLSRGYRRSSREPLLFVSDGVRTVAGPDKAGDEPYLIAQRCPKAVVAVGADRYLSGRRVLERHGADVIVLDDGFQHLGLHRDVNLLLVDATDIWGLQKLLPAGRLREPISATKRATAVIVTRAENPTQVDQVIQHLRSAVDSLPPIAQVTFRAAGLVSVATAATRALEWCQRKRTLLVSGVGHTASFQATAVELGAHIVDEVAYPDHHHYSVHDIETVRQRALELKTDLVLTTEKDAVKIQPYLEPDDGRWWAVRLRLEWLTGEAVIRRMVLDGESARHEAARA